MMKRRAYIIIGVAMTCLPMQAQTDSVATLQDQELQEVQVTTRRPGTVRSRGAMNAATITGAELTKAACCNLGESFTTNPSVDVSYNDAATGARQIRLLGLSGSYVQMLAENIPAYRGVAAPYALGYVPGPWMQSIQVSKGASSVKNGHESITGQINIEYKKPQAADQLSVNLYGNTMAKMEANADGNIHLSPRWSMGLLLHYEDKYKDHDDNHDGFMDEPSVRQKNAQLRWAYFSPSYIFQAGVRALGEDRSSGQTLHGTAHAAQDPADLYTIGIETHRYEAFAKNAYIFNPEHNTNLALMLNGSFHQMNSAYGPKTYDVIQRNAYAQLLFETDFTPQHNLSAGLSLNHDAYNHWLGYDRYHDIPDWSTVYTQRYLRWNGYDHQTTYGAYAQYTLNLNERLIAMAGIRADNTVNGRSFFTPRAHIKWSPADFLSLRLSAGKGHRYVFPLAENSHLLASGRLLRYVYPDQAEYQIDDRHPFRGGSGTPQLEEAWNYGLSAAFTLPLFGRELQLNAEYYYTDFLRQTVIDYDTSPEIIFIASTKGRSYSHTVQVDATYPIVDGMTATAAFRRNIVKSTYGNQLLSKPLQSKYKGLLTVSYKPDPGLWQIDATLQLNGGGRMPRPYTMADGTQSWADTFGAYEQVSAQITRWFRHFSIYAGGENLTGFRQKHPIIHADTPWNWKFEPTMIYGPVQGAMFYVGVRFNIEKF